LEVLDKLYPFLRFVPVLEWMVMASVSSAAKELLQRPALWQAACRLSVMKSGDEQDGCVNDVAQWAPGALCAVAAWMSRVCASRTPLDLLVGKRFPLLSPLCLHSHCAFEYLQIDSAVLEVRRAAMIGAKMWEAGMLLCALLARDETTWPAGLERMKGSSVLELGSGLGLVGVAVARHCRPATMVLTDAEPSCLKLAEVTIILNQLPVLVTTSVVVWGKRTGPLWRTADVVVASDVAYSLELVSDLWRTVAAILREEGTFIVAHLDRTPSSTKRLLEEAAQHRFELIHRYDLWALQEDPRLGHSMPALLLVFHRQKASR